MGHALELVTRSGHPDFLDLPWSEPLAAWRTPRLVDMVHGASRHVVRFVAYDERVYALKETSGGAAAREYRLLRALAEEGLPAVEAVGVARTPGGDPDRDRAILVTRYLDYSLPYTYLLSERHRPGLLDRLVDAGVVLLARLHLEGFFWGDFSLSNALFRRDAGEFLAYLVDAETCEQHAELGEPMRAHDVEIACENIAAGVADLQAGGLLGGEVDPLGAAESFAARYAELWAELTGEEVLRADERWRISRRMERLNAMGFDVEELAVVRSAGGDELRIRPTLVEEGHHSRELARLTGLRVQENQARRLLNDLRAFASCLPEKLGREVPEAEAAYRWLADVYRAAMARVPPGLGSRREPAELFHELLVHRDAMAARAGREVDIADALEDYLESVLPVLPEERVLRGSGEPRPAGDDLVR